MSADWHLSNQRVLLAELARIGAALSGDEPVPGEQPALDAAAQIAAQMDPPPAITQIVECFGLSDFERDVLLMCAGVELDGAFAALCADAGNRSGPTFGLALARLPGAHWSALAVTEPLRAWRLIELRDGTSLTSGQISIDERCLHFLVGVDAMPPLLAQLTYAAPPGELVPSHRAVAERVAAAVADQQPDALPIGIELCGGDAAALVDIGAVACSLVGLDLRVLSTARIAGSGAEVESFVRLWGRESALTGTALLVDCSADTSATHERDTVIDHLLADLTGPVLLAVPARRSRWPRRQAISFEVRRPTEGEQSTLWREGIAVNGHTADPTSTFPALPDVLAGYFDLGARAIEATCREVSIAAASGEPPDYWNTCRGRARADLADLARRIEPRCTWSDLVASDVAVSALRAIVQQVRHRHVVHHEWGFGTRGSRGLGVSALFAGPSGTGKTMAAEVLAAELQLDLFAIDLSAMVSKFIGETEKNLNRVFDVAESSGAILLFDEADALFGKRSEVRDSHDRYANIEVSFLLQRIEAYRGVAILTSNKKDAVDQAFLRRFGFIVEFPFPSEEMRADLWRRAFPASTPTDGLEPELLAQLHLSGGSIKNVAMVAAFQAAANGGTVTMDHVQRAARLEYVKTDRSITPAELRGWP